jgi:hypothetical protein
MHNPINIASQKDKTPKDKSSASMHTKAKTHQNFLPLKTREYEAYIKLQEAIGQVTGAIIHFEYPSSIEAKALVEMLYQFGNCFDNPDSRREKQGNEADEKSDMTSERKLLRYQPPSHLYTLH